MAINPLNDLVNLYNRNMKIKAKKPNMKRNAKKRRLISQEIMPGKEWMEPYLASSLQELKERAEKENKLKDKLSSSTTKDHCTYLLKVMDDLFDLSEEHRKKMDVEKAYLFLYRYIEIMIFIQKKYTQQQDFCKKYIGKRANIVMDNLEQYSKILEQSYELKKFKKKEDVKIMKEKEYELPEEIKQKRLKRNENSDLKEGKFKKIEYENLVKCKNLKEMIEGKNKNSVLIIDVRNPSAYDISRIKFQNQINIPSSIIQSGLSANTLEERLVKESLANKEDKVLPTKIKQLWDRRKEFEYVVLVDKKTDLTPASALTLLKEILLHWDYPVSYKHDPVCLEEGFDGWVDTFPALTINPGFKNVRGLSSTNTVSSLDCITYPELDDEADKKQMKFISSVPKIDPIMSDSFLSIKQQINQLPSKPTIDRSTKPSDEKITVSKPEKDVVRKPLQNIQESQVSDRNKNVNKDNEDESLNNGSTFNDMENHTNKLLLAEKNLRNTEKENQFIIDNISPKTDWKKNDLETSYEALKPESSNNSSSGLKRSLSSPNIAKLADDDDVSFEKTPPRFDRSTKPIFKNQTESPHYSMQDKHRGTDGLESAVMGANISRGLTGLKNLGNTCYMNSILQCVSNTTDLREELCKFHPADTCYKNNNNLKSKTEGIVAREVEKVVRILWQGNIKYFSCVDLKTVVGKFRNSFRGCEQQDSHEFFTILMDWLHEDLNEPSPKGELTGAIEETGEKAWGEFKKENNSIVLNLFYGQQKSTVTCDTCGKKSVTFEPFSNLSLLLPSYKDRCTLTDCLDLYMKGEAISGWNCPACKTARNATKKVDITRLPPVLVMHFKRFTSNGWCRKKQTHVDFPLEGLDMRKFAVDGSEQRNEIYNLYAVSNHYGTMESGHYTAYCHNADLNRWFKFDDHEVVEISPSSVKTSAAYILFYSAVKR